VIGGRSWIVESLSRLEDERAPRQTGKRDRVVTTADCVVLRCAPTRHPLCAVPTPEDPGRAEALARTIIAELGDMEASRPRRGAAWRRRVAALQQRVEILYGRKWEGPL